ncbi:MAG TPA: hypothetical protein QGI71_08580 [Dehalococcoidia bacterium]|jgi:hypothetical protein|nr:hypothetical protein [Dehalococcoidia bacterium]
MRYAVLGFFVFATLIAIGIAAYIQFDFTLAEIRDVVIVIFGLLAVLLLIIMVVTLLALLVAVRLATSALGELRRERVQPALDNLRASAKNVRGATEFMADSAVHPVIRAVSVTRGIRRGIGLVTGIGRKRE